MAICPAHSRGSGAWGKRAVASTQTRSATSASSCPCARRPATLMASGGVACFDAQRSMILRICSSPGCGVLMRGQLDRRLVGLGDAQVEARQIVRRRRARPRLQQRAQVVALEAAAAEPEWIGADAGVVALEVETGQLVDDERRRPHARDTVSRSSMTRPRPSRARAGSRSRWRRRRAASSMISS